MTPVCWLTVYLQIANRKLTGPIKEKFDEQFVLPQFSGIHLCRVAEVSLNLSLTEIEFELVVYRN